MECKGYSIGIIWRQRIWSKRIWVFSFLFFLGINVCFPKRVVSKDFETPEELQKWITTFYLHRDNTSVVSAIKAMFKNGVFDEEDAECVFAISFLSSVFEQNQDKLETWYAELDDLDLSQKKYIWQALNFSKCPQCLKLLNKLKERSTPAVGEFIEQLLSIPYQDPLVVEIDHPGSLEVFWGIFFASGDERYVKRIISFLSGFEQTNDEKKLQIAKAAKAYLIEDASQHQLVLDICRKEQAVQSDEIKKVLEEIIQEAEKRRQEKLSGLDLEGLGSTEEVETEIVRLHSQDVYERERAAIKLGNYRTNEAVSALIEALQDKEVTVRMYAAHSLGQIKNSFAVEPLVACLRDEDRGVQLNALNALKAIVDKRHIEIFMNLLKDTAPEIRAYAAEILGNIEDPQVIDALITALNDEDKVVRHRAVRALGNIKDARAEKPLLELLVREKDRIVTMSILKSLEEIRNKNLIKKEGIKE